MQKITMYLRADSVKATLVDSYNNTISQVPSITRGLHTELTLKLLHTDGTDFAANELSFSNWTLAVCHDWDTSTPPQILVMTGISVTGNAIVIPMTDTNTETLVALLGTNEQVTLGCELIGNAQNETFPSFVLQFQIVVRNRRYDTNSPTPIPEIVYVNTDMLGEGITVHDNAVKGRITLPFSMDPPTLAQVLALCDTGVVVYQTSAFFLFPVPAGTAMDAVLKFEKIFSTYFCTIIEGLEDSDVPTMRIGRKDATSQTWYWTNRFPFEVVNNLSSTSTTTALSAYQGNYLANRLNNAQVEDQKLELVSTGVDTYNVKSLISQYAAGGISIGQYITSPASLKQYIIYPIRDSIYAFLGRSDIDIPIKFKFLASENPFPNWSHTAGIDFIFEGFCGGPGGEPDGNGVYGDGLDSLRLIKVNATSGSRVFQALNNAMVALQ